MSAESLKYVKDLCASNAGAALTGTEKLVMRALALFWSEKVGCAYASLEDIGREALIGGKDVKRAVRRTVASLEGKGLVLRHEARRDSSGSQTTNEYELPGMQSSAVGTEVHQRGFRVPRSRVARQLKLSGAARLAVEVGAELSSPPRTLLSSPPRTRLSSLEVKYEERSEENLPLPLPFVPDVEKGKDLPVNAKAGATARATATATTVPRDDVWASNERGGGMWPGSVAGAEKLDGIDAALWNETTRVLLAIGISPETSTRRLRRVVHEALGMRCGQAHCPVADAGLLAVTRWREYSNNARALRYTVGVRKFFADGLWLDMKTWPWDYSRPTEGFLSRLPS